MMVMMRFNRRILLWSSDRLQREGVSARDVSKNGDKIKRSSPRLNTKSALFSSLISLVGSRFRVTLFEREKK